MPPDQKLAASTLAEVVQLARASPGKMTWASAPSVPYLAFTAFLKEQELELLYVPYRNPLASIADIAEGQIDLTMFPLAPMVGPAQAGKLKLIVVTSDDHAPLAPQVPTAGERSGVPGPVDQCRPLPVRAEGNAPRRCVSASPPTCATCLACRR